MQNSASSEPSATTDGSTHVPQALIDALPKTADGELIYPGMQLWYLNEHGTREVKCLYVKSVFGSQYWAADCTPYWINPWPNRDRDPVFAHEKNAVAKRVELLESVLADAKSPVA